MKRFYRAFLLGALLLAACGRQDRFEIIAPAQSIIATDGPTATLQDVPLLAFESYFLPRVRFIEGALHFLTFDSHLYRYEDGAYTIYSRPPMERPDLVDFLADHDGVLWTMQDDGEGFFRWLDDHWERDSAIAGSPDLFRLLVDAQGRLLAWGKRGGLWRRHAGGSWSSLLPEGGPDLVAAWEDPDGGDPILLGDRFELITSQGDDWEVGSALLEERYNAQAEIQRDGAGRTAILAPNLNKVFLNEGGGWTEISWTAGLRTLFWWQDDLCAIGQESGKILHWTGDDWEIWREFQEELNEDYRSVQTVALPAGRLISRPGGDTYLLDESGVRQVSPYIGHVSGFAMNADERRLVTETGLHARSDGGPWSVLEYGRDGYRELHTEESLFALPDGGFLQLGRSTLHRWEVDGEVQALDPGDGLRRAFQQDDGSVIVVGDTRLWRFVADQWQDLGPRVNDPGDLTRIERTGDGKLYLGYPDRLQVLPPGGEITTVLTFQGWACLGMVSVPGQGVCGFGAGRFFSLTTQDSRDWTPLWYAEGGPEPALLVTAVADGRGGVLAYDHERQALLHFDGTGWSLREEGSWEALGEPYFLRCSPDGTLFMQDGADAAFLEVTVP